MSKPLSPRALEGIGRAQDAVRNIIAGTPYFVEGPKLVSLLMEMLNETHKGDQESSRLACLGLAAAAIAMLIENERAEKRGERVVAA